jgi:hypothetical protein
MGHEHLLQENGPQECQTVANGRSVFSQVDICIASTEWVSARRAGHALRPTGTPGGVGNERNPPVFMKPGDVVEVEVDAIGVLRNTVADD